MHAGESVRGDQAHLAQWTVHLPAALPERKATLTISLSRLKRCLLPNLRNTIFLNEIKEDASLRVEHLHNELKRKGCKTKAVFSLRVKVFPELKSAVLRQ